MPRSRAREARPEAKPLARPERTTEAPTSAFGLPFGFSNRIMSRTFSRLPVSQPGDAFELEAGSLAAAVLNGSSASAALTASLPAVHRECECGGTCHDCKSKVMRAAEGAGPPVAPASVHRALQAPGVPLDYGVAADLGAGFTRTLGVHDAAALDFSHVRIHTDSQATASARDVHAAAYTVGHHIVFAEDRYQPYSLGGRALLAHELAHVVQQSAGNRALGRLLRTWEDPNGECDPLNLPAGKWLRKVIVDQEVPQNITLQWSDRTEETATASTGKGLCCSDSPEGISCTAEQSVLFGTNCTPITSGLPILDRFRSRNGWKFWNTIVRHRGIGLHQHHTVTGHPLSHGCVRLEEITARKIFCGARQGRTMVAVKGFARPRCHDTGLQAEWRGDFNYAGINPDGESPSVRQGIRETREALRKAFGINDQELDALIAQMGANPAQVGSRIPRCKDAAEPDRLVTSAAEFRRLLRSFRTALSRARSLAAAETVVRNHVRDLWSLGTAAFQRATGPVQDDRVTFWTRLLMSHALRRWQPRFTIAQADRERFVNLLEQTSRGMDTAAFSGAAGVKKVLVSGFDPFGLTQDVRVNNPSGAAALLLDGRILTSGTITAEVQSVIFPVRFADFNTGIVETFFRPFLTGAGRVDMIMTISQGDSEFEVERFAGKRRSTGITDDFGVSGGGTPTSPQTPPGIRASAPEFRTTRLPAASMRASLGRTKPLTEETEVREIPVGGTDPVDVPSAGPSVGSTAVRGSGGGFLSNEIMYRTLLLRSDVGATVPVGHLHVPIPTAALTAPKIAERVEQLITDTLPNL